MQGPTGIGGPSGPGYIPPGHNAPPVHSTEMLEKIAHSMGITVAELSDILKKLSSDDTPVAAQPLDAASPLAAKILELESEIKEFKGG